MKQCERKEPSDPLLLKKGKGVAPEAAEEQSGLSLALKSYRWAIKKYDCVLIEE